MARQEPDLSVILIVERQRVRAGRALASLLQQSAIERMEILLIDLAGAYHGPIAGSQHSRVRIHYETEAATYGQALAAGVRSAEAPVVAFLEEHARALPGWGDALLNAHRGPWAGVGCLVTPAAADNRLSAASSMLNDRLWRPGSPGGEAETIRGHNSAYKRGVLLDLEPKLVQWLEFEPLLHEHLRGMGFQLLVDPQARITHLNDTTIASTCRVYRTWNRALGPARGKFNGWGVLGRLGRIIALPAIPFWRTLVLAWAYRHDPPAFRQLLWLLPEILLIGACAAFGQSVGLLLGPGDGLKQFKDHELNADRWEPQPLEGSP